jgi:hypothetical protein
MLNTEVVPSELQGLQFEPLLDTAGAAEYLTSLGISRSPATLVRQRSTGGLTPPFRSVGRSIRYSPSDLRAWVSAVVSAPRRSTSDTKSGPT